LTQSVWYGRSADVPRAAGRHESREPRRGPLTGVRVVEIAALGPGPYAAMLLADLGADVVRVDQPFDVGSERDIVRRGRRSVIADLKAPEGIALVLDLVAEADALIEGFRPGVAERLGIGPDVCRARNRRLVYGRMTGWGQDGPYADKAGHDINYVALAGALAHIGRAGDRPLPPLNLVGDMGGGGMLLAFGTVCALFEAQRSGDGQVVDAAMVDGVASLMTLVFGFHAQGFMRQELGSNVFDTGAHFYEVYECADGKHLSVGAIEGKFYRALIAALGLDGEPGNRSDPAVWPVMKQRFAEVFRTRTRDEWCDRLDGYTELCVAPVLSMLEAPRHPHLAHRGTYVDLDGVLQPAPAPRFSRTPGAIHRPPPVPGGHTDEVVDEWLGRRAATTTLEE
jgi:alpha-methylacyl-CoA racemase